ncbi:MAG: hypothetical protein CL910_02725 [Deltaproteobacteria bacterium]|jgi:hypothetical protein|nr:hypothetical protein [Deltaproteobacteria bacterium]
MQQTSLIVWVALLLSQAVYVGISVFWAPESSTSPVTPAFVSALFLVSVATGSGAHFFWRRSQAAQEEQPESENRGAPGSVFANQIIAWVLDESVAIYGVVLAFLGFEAATWGLFSVMALALMLLHRPSKPAA